MYISMIDKARNNLKAAQRIIDANDASICFASIHCSYYSVFQYMKYILAHLKVRPYTYEQQDSNEKSASHERILLEIQNRLVMKREDERDFKFSFDLLKKQRKMADYTDSTFTVEECIGIRDLAVSLHSTLNSQFKNRIS